VTDLFVDAAGSPDGATVVLVHGSMDRSSAWLKVVRRLGDLRTVRYDRRGYAKSLDAFVTGRGTIAGHASDLLDVLDGAGVDSGRPAALVGHSLGGNIALAAAARAPELVSAVVVFESPMSWETWWPGTTAGAAVLVEGDPGDHAEAFLRRMLGAQLWERLPERTRLERRAEGRALVEELVDLRAHAPYDADAITVPVVCGYGTNGAEHHRHGCEVLAERLGAHVMAIEGARHGAHTSHPDEFAALIRRAIQAPGTVTS
jgi:pimeloyl-ACP methyl ester carboxylesterase